MSKILFVGDLNEFGRGYQRCETLQDLGHDVVPLTHSIIFQSKKISPPSLISRVFTKLRIPLDEVGANKKCLQAMRSCSFDVVWIEKGNMIWPHTLSWIKKNQPGVKLVSCSEDDMYAKHGHSLWYRIGLKFYDVVFTTKKYNLQELITFGAQKTILFLDSFDERIHRPWVLSEEELEKFSCEVSAIGAFELERAKSLLFLANKGIRVSVWGSGWEKWDGVHPNLDFKKQFLFGTDYCKAICASKINLNFLRKINRDQVTSRSIEIPACGGFMLAERTERHLEFFEEGHEAEFFGSHDELLKKVLHYLGHDQERDEIAAAGRDRCLKSGYSMRYQMAKMLSELNLKNEPTLNTTFDS